MCVVEGLQKTTDEQLGFKANQNALVTIEKAYSNAFDDATKDDVQLNEKKR